MDDFRRGMENILRFYRLLPHPQPQSQDFDWIPPAMAADATRTEREHRLTLAKSRRDKLFRGALTIVNQLKGLPPSRQASNPVDIDKFCTIVRQLCALNMAITLQKLQTKAQVTAKQSHAYLPIKVLQEIFFAAMPHDGPPSKWNKALLTFRLLSTSCARQVLTRDNPGFWAIIWLSPETPLLPNALIRQRRFYEGHRHPTFKVRMNGPVYEMSTLRKLLDDPRLRLDSLCDELTISATWNDWQKLKGIMPRSPLKLRVLRLICRTDSEFAESSPTNTSTTLWKNKPPPPLFVPAMANMSLIQNIKLCTIDLKGCTWTWSLMDKLTVLDLAAVRPFRTTDLYGVLRAASRLSVLRLWDMDFLDFDGSDGPPITTYYLVELAFSGVDRTIQSIMEKVLRPRKLRRLLLQRFDNRSCPTPWIENPVYFTPTLTRLIIGLDRNSLWTFSAIFRGHPSLESLEVRLYDEPLLQVVFLLSALRDVRLLKRLDIVVVRCSPDSEAYENLTAARDQLARLRPDLAYFVRPISAVPDDAGQWWSFNSRDNF